MVNVAVFLGYIGSVAAANEVSGNFIIDTKVEAPANTNAGEEHRKSSICVGTLHGVAGQSLVIDMPFGYIQGSTFNGSRLIRQNIWVCWAECVSRMPILR